METANTATEQMQSAIQYFKQILSKSETNNTENVTYYQLAVAALENLQRQTENVSINLFDTEEIYPNCTVQIWSNSHTGECSVGWWRNT